MTAYRIMAIIYGAVFLMGSAMDVESDTFPEAVEFVKILLKNGTRIGKGCNTEVYGPTLQDKLAELVSPEGSGSKVIITYRCIDDKREAPDTQALVPVWRCVFRGEGIWKNNDSKVQKEDIEVYSTSIYAYLDKRNLKIVDLFCL